MKVKKNKKFKYVYHVVYRGENVYGDCTLHRLYKMNTPEQVLSAKQFISSEYCQGNPVIIENFILLNTSGREA